MSIAALLVMGSHASLSTASTTWFGTLTGSSASPFAINSTTEARTQCPAAVAGTFNNFYVNLFINGRSTDSTAALRIAGADTAIVVTLTAGVTGVFSDTSHSATCAQDDLLSWRVTSGTGAGSIGDSICGANFTPSSGNTAFSFGNDTGGNTASGSGPLTTYWALSSNVNPNSTLARNQLSNPVAGTMSYLYANCITNGRASSGSTIKLSINGSVGNQVLSWAASTTGFVKDTTHTDAVVAGDLITTQVDLGTGTGSFTTTCIGVWEVATTDGQSCAASATGAGTSLSAATTPSDVFGGRVNPGTVEAELQGKLPAATASKAWIYVSANASTTNSPMKFRKNGADGNQNVSITALTTGPFQDSSNSDSFTASDNINYQFSNITTGAITIHGRSALITISGVTTAIWFGNLQTGTLDLSRQINIIRSGP